MFFDALTHVTPDGRWFDSTCDASEDALLRALDAAGVERAVVVALAGVIENSFVHDVCTRHRDRLVAGASFDPSAHTSLDRAAQAIRRQLRAAGFPVLKLHPRLNRYDVLDPRCLAVLEEVAGWPAPPVVFIDSLLHARGVPLQRSVPDAFHELAGRFPSLRLVLLHAGGPWALQLAAAVRDCPNVHLDLSFVLHRYRGSALWQDLRFLVNTFDRRLVWGSDFPEVLPTTARRDWATLTAPTDHEEAVDDARIARVMGGNMTALLAGGA